MPEPMQWAAQRLQQAYADALDRRDMPAWLATFAQDASYELTTQENRRLKLPVGMMMDDCHARLRDRVKYVEEVWNHAVEHYQTRHIVYPLALTPSDDHWRMRCNFVVYYTPSDGHTKPLVAGQYEDLIRVQDGAAQFVSKCAIMDTAVPPHYLIYPI